MLSISHLILSLLPVDGMVKGCLAFCFCSICNHFFCIYNLQHATKVSVLQEVTLPAMLLIIGLDKFLTVLFLELLTLVIKGKG